jgi:fatty acid desaturase
MNKLGEIKRLLVMAAVVCLAVRVVFWAIEPLFPYIMGALVFVVVLGYLWFRTTKL